MSKTADEIKIYQSGIVNLNIFVKKNEDNSITITQSNDFTHDEINVMEVNRKELSLAIYPESSSKDARIKELEARLETAEKGIQKAIVFIGDEAKQAMRNGACRDVVDYYDNFKSELKAFLTNKTE